MIQNNIFLWQIIEISLEKYLRISGLNTDKLISEKSGNWSVQSGSKRCSFWNLKSKPRSYKFNVSKSHSFSEYLYSKYKWH